MIIFNWSPEWMKQKKFLFSGDDDKNKKRRKKNSPINDFTCVDDKFVERGKSGVRRKWMKVWASSKWFAKSLTLRTWRRISMRRTFEINLLHVPNFKKWKSELICVIIKRKRTFAQGRVWCPSEGHRPWWIEMAENSFFLFSHSSFFADSLDELSEAHTVHAV